MAAPPPQRHQPRPPPFASSNGEGGGRGTMRDPSALLLELSAQLHREVVRSPGVPETVRQAARIYESEVFAIAEKIRNDALNDPLLTVVEAGAIFSAVLKRHGVEQ